MAYPENPLKLLIIREKNPALPLWVDDEPTPRELMEPPDLPYQ
jgi:hypothetical protein